MLARTADNLFWLARYVERAEFTARLAAEAGREVMAIPGSILSPQSAGCHALIRQGAALCEGA